MGMMVHGWVSGHVASTVFLSDMETWGGNFFQQDVARLSGQKILQCPPVDRGKNRREPSQEQNICGCLGHICPFVVAVSPTHTQPTAPVRLLAAGVSRVHTPPSPGLQHGWEHGAWAGAARGGRVCGLGRGGLPCRWPDALSCRGHGAGISCHASRALQMAHMGPLPQPAWRNPCGHWTVGRTVDELWPSAPSPSSVQCPVSTLEHNSRRQLSSSFLPIRRPFSARLIRRSWLRRAPPLFVRFIAPHLDLPINPSLRIASRTATRQSSRPHRATRHPLQTLSTELPPHSAWRLGC